MVKNLRKTIKKSDKRANTDGRDGTDFIFRTESTEITEMYNKNGSSSI